MKLICKNCKSEIPQSNVNLQKGIAHCTRCNEFFKIADFLNSSEELRRIAKPIDTKIEFRKEFDKINIEIPAAGWSTTAFFLLFFSVVWNGISWVIPFETIIISIPFKLVGIFVVANLFFIVFGKTILVISKNVIVVKWSLFGLNYSRKKPFENLYKITEDVIYTKNYQPVYGIGLFFNNDEKIKFGSSLNEGERKWLIGELYELKEILSSQ